MVFDCPEQSLWGFFSSPRHSTPSQPSCRTPTLDHSASKSPCFSHFCSTHQVPRNVLNVLLMLTPIFKRNYEVSTINILLAQMRTWGTEQLISLLLYLVTAEWLVLEPWSGSRAGVCSCAPLPCALPVTWPSCAFSEILAPTVGLLWGWMCAPPPLPDTAPWRLCGSGAHSDTRRTLPHTYPLAGSHNSGQAAIEGVLENSLDILNSSKERKGYQSGSLKTAWGLICSVFRAFLSLFARITLSRVWEGKGRWGAEGTRIGLCPWAETLRSIKSLRECNP